MIYYHYKVVMNAAVCLSLSVYLLIYVIIYNAVSTIRQNFLSEGLYKKNMQIILKGKLSNRLEIHVVVANTKYIYLRNL